jgi:3-phenylpropionate/trans-cinnamate dioxygenase ferredoxin subunit
LSQEFVHVAQTSDLEPGAKKRVYVGEQRVMLTNVDGVFYALDDLCPHALAVMSAGWLDGDEIVCPLHGARFNVKTGEVLSSPAEEDMTVFAVKIEGENVLVCVPGAGDAPRPS